MAHRRQKRRGVLLLVSLVLLVLFLMLGVTFVLMAGNFRRSSEAYRRLQESGNATANAENLLHGVARDLVRGTHNPESPFSKENLLEDMYGQPALRGKVTGVSPVGNTDGQFTDLTITEDADFSFSSVAGYYSGLVLTMVTGDAAGQSTRIVGSSNTGGYKLTVMTLPGWVDPSSAPQVDDLILVNGRPFSGDGTGNAGTDTTRRLNEDYDKADLNNPWLAATNPSWSDTNFKWGTAEEEGNDDNRPKDTTRAVDNDNDSDGTKESIWIDAGLPLQVQSDGSYVKPLVAMLVRDLDGRVNVNAHGSADQLAALAGASAPIGQGYGPAEINPDFVLDEGATAVLLQGRPADPSQGLPYIKGRHADVPETETNPVPGRSGDDPLSAVAQFHHYGGDLNAFVTPHDIDGTSKAVVGATGQIEFQDASGNTFTSGATNFQDDPYEMQLDTALGSPQDDSPFTPGDLEAVFRHRDVDAGSLSDRLQTALTVGVADVDKPAAYDRFRDRVTTESWDLPVHPVALPAELADPPLLSDPPAHISDLITARIMKSQGEEDEETARTQAIAIIDSGLVDREMLAGLKFNVNRLFGNGKDDDTNSSAPGYGVVDEPGEAGTGTAPAYGSSVTDLLPAGTVRNQFTSVDFDHNGDGFTFPWDVDEDGNEWPAVDDPDDRPYRMADLAVRQQYAKQLYLLLMLVSNIDDDLKDVVTQVTDPDDQRRLLARRLAQFAVNAVDYRDADSIMTGFEYDASPFDGWDADGDLDDSTPAGNNDIGVVWGAEAPAAVLTGTLALHDMRVKDTDVGGTDVGGTVAGGKTTVAIRVLPEELSQLPNPLPNPGEPLGIGVQDEDFDQYAPPQGSLFLQIHALPNAYPTRDLYQSTGQLKLSKTHDDTASGDPVWRVAISEPHALGQSTKDTAGQGSPVFNQLRNVDVEQDPVATEVVDANEATASQWNPLVTMQPDSFDALQDNPDDNEVQNQVVIERVVYFANTPGSATPEDAQYYNQDSTDVLLTPGASKVVGPRPQTSVRAAGLTTDTVTSDVVCTLDVMPANWTGDGTNPGMSVSEPLENNYYNDQGSELVDDPMMSGDQIYSPAFDSPFDQTKLVNITEFLQENDVATITDEQTPPGTVDVDRPSIGGTVENYCTAFLQRLANPLLPWNPLPDNPDYDPALEVNPYITVDAMPIDLTVYNGDGGGVVWDVSAMTVKATPDPEYPDNFDSRGWRERAKLAEPMGTLTSSLTEPSASAITTTSDPAPFWPNRPFVSQYELLMVPASEPGKLSFELGAHNNGTPQTNFGDGFPHLLNFFYEVSSEPRLGRLFDYLHVPSRYAGTQTTLRPDNFAGVADFAPPFNRISNYREPGRVNLNTIEDASVWESVMHGAPGDTTAHPGAAYSGHPQGNNIQGKRFRSSSYAELDGEPLPPAQPPLLTSGGSSPMFADASQTADPFLRYGPINRLGNLVGTRSNVYAVWMTLGFFEVDSSGTVGNEAGSDTGEIGRHRAFYMIDRSIPVGYENGQDHNTEDVFRMQRFIE